MSLKKQNIIKMLQNRGLTGNQIKYEVLFNKNTQCLICCEKLTSSFYMRAYGNFCKSCGLLCINPLQNYFSQQFFWNF